MLLNKARHIHTSHCCATMTDVDNVWTRYSRYFAGSKCTLQGHSVSARSSCFWVPEWHVMFDAGIASSFAPLHIFLTHGHSDHAFQLPMILTSSQKPAIKPTVYVPVGVAQLVRDFLLAKHRLSRCDATAVLDIDALCTLREVRDGDTFEIKVRGDMSMTVQVFATEHKVPSVGFALFHNRTRLKSKFFGFTGKELAQMRDDGAELNECVRVPCMAYVGDSTPKWLSHSIFADNIFPLIVCECTFVGALEGDGGQERALAAAHEHGHTEWSQLEPLIAERGAQTQFCLVHWSNRYTVAEIERFFRDKPHVFAWTN